MKSRVKGVHWLAVRGKWQAMAYIDGKQKSLGVFDHLIDAEAARIKYDSEKRILKIRGEIQHHEYMLKRLKAMLPAVSFL